MIYKKLLVYLLAVVILLTGCTNKKPEPISSDLALEYLRELQDYVEQTGDTDIYLYILEDIDRDYLLDYMEDTLSETYYEGWNDCYDEIEANKDEWFWDGYYCGAVDGYEEGYADGSNGLPFNEEMVDRLLHGYFDK